MGARKAVVCDDDRAMAEILKHLLEKEGYSVWSASGGEESADLIEAERPQLLIVDVQSARKEGLALLQRLGPSVFRQGVIVLAQAEHEELHWKARAMGASKVVKKPFLAAELARAIHEVAFRNVPQ